jgi:hypothetical protein
MIGSKEDIPLDLLVGTGHRLPTAKSLWPSLEQLGRCEAQRESRYQESWEAEHPDKQCMHAAKYQIGENRYCARHAGVAALKILIEASKP